jgi:hypothetical protein
LPEFSRTTSSQLQPRLPAIPKTRRTEKVEPF